MRAGDGVGCGRARSRAHRGWRAIARAHRVRASWAFGPLSDDDADATGDLARRERARRASRAVGDRARVGREGVEDICLHACASRTCVIARRGGRGRGECVIENSCAPQGDEVARGVHVTPCGSARMAYISR